MKRFLYLLPAFALVFAACSDDDDNNGNGNGGGSIKGHKVELSAQNIKDAPGNDVVDQMKLVTDAGSVLAATEWKNGFALQFPDGVTAASLGSIEDALLEDRDGAALKELQASDEKAKICIAQLKGYKNNDLHGTLFKGINADRKVIYIYSDSDVTIKGSVEYYGSIDKDIEKFDLSLEKGWNEVFESETRVSVITTRELRSIIPTGMSWVYEKDSGRYEPVEKEQ